MTNTVGSPGAKSFMFTVCIPSYNRAYILPMAIAALEKQTFRDFELLIIDDGSKDGTDALVREWQQKVAFPIVYHWQPNQGMHSALNTGARLARGEYFYASDSDDEIVPNALERIKFHLDSIPPERRDQFAGVEGLMEDTRGNLSGSRYPQNVMESDYLETRLRLGVGGEKRNAIRTDILRQYPYPQIEGERYVRVSIILEEISERYKFLCVNEVFERFEYHPDGMTQNILKFRSLNPRGFRLYYLENIVRRSRYYPARKLFFYYVKYVRFSLLSGIGLIQQWKEIPSKSYWIAALPLALIKWPRDYSRRQYYLSKLNG